MLMKFLTLIKTWGIQAVDLVQKIISPYKPITRPFLPKTLRPLSTRAQECWDDLADFWRYDELMIHRIPLPEPQALDTGDQAIWHGIYTAMLAFRYYLKPDILGEALLSRALVGLENHQTIHGESKPRLIRGYERNADGTIRWEDDASNDSLTGHLAGLYFTFRFGPAALREKCLTLIGNIASSLLDHDMNLVKADGTPTKHGKLINGVSTDPLQMSLALAVMVLAEKYNLDPRAGKARHDIWDKYGAMLAYGKVDFLSLGNWNDQHRAALHLVILALEDKSKRMQGYAQDGFRRLWNLCLRQGNIWVNALIALGMNSNLPDGLRDLMRKQALMFLGEYELTEKRFDTEKLNAGKTLVGANGNSWLVETWDDKGKKRCFQPPPAWCMGGQDFIWQRHRYTADDRIGVHTPSSRHNGADFLAAYYLSRMEGILNSTD
jgi:hypothetical protein